MKLKTKASLVRGVFFFTTHLLPYRPFKAAIRAAFSRHWRPFVKATKTPGKAQTALLAGLLKNNAGSEFGKKHGFGGLVTAADYKNAVPVASYESFEPYIERMRRGEKNVLVSDEVIYFARTSGTTGRSKSIPVTNSYLDEYRRAQNVWYRNFALQFPGMIKGNPLTIVSNKVESYTEAGIPCGSLSRPMTFRESDLADEVVSIPRGVFYMDDFNSKYYTLMRIALGTRISTIAAVNPSTHILFARKLNEFSMDMIKDIRDGTLKNGLSIEPELRRRIEGKLKPDPKRAAFLEKLLNTSGVIRPVDAWPMLCGLACWKGGSAEFYLRQFSQWYGDVPVMEIGFIASEGHFSIPLDANGNSGVFSLTSHFCEFIPKDIREAAPMDPHPKTLLAHELEKGGMYYIVVSASHGLYRYDMNDLVEVTGFFNETPMLRFVHKGGNMLSVTGEKVGESHVVTAVNAASGECGVPLNAFSVSVRLDSVPRYIFAVEPAAGTDDEDLESLLKACDRELAKANYEYDEKRRTERLGDPVLLVLKKGSFERYRANAVKAGAPDAHVKPPHLFRTEELLREKLEVV